MVTEEENLWRPAAAYVEENPTSTNVEIGLLRRSKEHNDTAEYLRVSEGEQQQQQQQQQ